MIKKTLVEQARCAENPRDVLLDEAHRIIKAIYEGRIDIKSVRIYLESEDEIRNLPTRDFFDSLEQARENRRQWGIPR